MLAGMVIFSLLVSGEVQVCTNSKGWPLQPSIGLT